MARNLFVLVRPHPLQVLLMPGEHGWTLPEIQTPCMHKWWRETQAVNEAIRSHYGLSVVVLRCLQILRPMVDGARTAVFLVESRDPDREPVQGGQPLSSCSWVIEQDLVHLAFADPAHLAIVRESVAELSGAGASRLMPWEHTGWFERASAWMTEEADKAGRTLTGPIVQVRNHGYMSSVLRAPTTQGALYLKACPPMWAQEPSLTAELAVRHGDLVPVVLSVHMEERWLLTVAAEGQKLNTLRDREQYLSLWKSLLRLYGLAQIEYARDPAYLLNLGCPDWRVGILSAFIRHFLLDLVPAISTEQGDFPVWHRAELERAAARLEESCSRLATYNIPDTLHHGDFHSVNILTEGRSCRVVDWAFQAGVSHPFFFMSVVFEEHVDPIIRSHLRDHYLRLWTDFEPMNRLIDAFELAQPLAVLHAAMGHYVQLGSTRTPWERGPEREALTYYLTSLVTHVGK